MDLNRKKTGWVFIPQYLEDSVFRARCPQARIFSLTCSGYVGMWLGGTGDDVEFQDISQMVTFSNVFFQGRARRRGSSGSKRARFIWGLASNSSAKKMRRSKVPRANMWRRKHPWVRSGTGLGGHGLGEHLCQEKNSINAIGTGNRNDRNRRGCLSPHMEIFCWEKPEVCYKRGVFLLPFNLSRFEGLLVLTWGRFTWKTYTTSLSAHTLFCRKNRDCDHSTRIYTS